MSEIPPKVRYVDIFLQSLLLVCAQGPAVCRYILAYDRELYDREE